MTTKKQTNELMESICRGREDIKAGRTKPLKKYLKERDSAEEKKIKEDLECVDIYYFYVMSSNRNIIKIKKSVWKYFVLNKQVHVNPKYKARNTNAVNYLGFDICPSEFESEYKKCK